MLYVLNCSKVNRNFFLFLTYVLLYLLVYSSLGHKEPRFLTPCLPMIFVILGSFCNALNKSSYYGQLVKFMIVASCIVEVSITVVYNQFEQTQYQVFKDLPSKPHSLYFMERLTVPLHTLTHQPMFGT